MLDVAPKERTEASRDRNYWSVKNPFKGGVPVARKGSARIILFFFFLLSFFFSIFLSFFFFSPPIFLVGQNARLPEKCAVPEGRLRKKKTEGEEGVEVVAEGDKRRNNNQYDECVCF